MYDGIANSVFESQVVAPLHSQIETNQLQSCIIISFERTPASIPKSITNHPSLSLIQLHQLPFLGTISLWHAYRQLKLLRIKWDEYEVVARGPLAGWIAQKINTIKQLIIQARGLAAEEYRYTHQDKKKQISFVHRIRAWQYEQIERTVYAKNTHIIEAVSPALKSYLIQTFSTNPKQITIAQHDIPQVVAPHTIKQWRTATRAQLKIPDDAQVYLYCGSAKPWQCPHQTISYFDQLKNPKKHLLILSKDTQAFKKTCSNLKKDHCTIISVLPDDMLRVMAAADYGFLFRDAHPMNWVSRPTKLLEYQAVGLKIIHNNTVAYAQN